MCGDEFVGGVVIAEIAQETAAEHPDFQVLAHLEVEVRLVHAEVVADAGDLLAAVDLFALVDGEVQEVAVEGIDKFQLGTFVVGVAEDDDIAPADVVIAGKGDVAIGRGVDRVTEIGVAAAHPVPVFAEMAVWAVAARDVIT